MMKTVCSYLVGLMLCAFLSVSGAEAQKTTRKVQAISLATHKEFERIQLALEQHDLVQAKSLVQQLLNKEGAREYERSIVWQYNAQIAFAEENTPEAIRSFENVLLLKDFIPVAQAHGAMYILAQLHFSESDFRKAYEVASDWKDLVPQDYVNAAQWQFLSMLAYYVGDYARTVADLEKFFDVIDNAQRNSRGAKNMYLFLAAAHWQLESYEDSWNAIRAIVSDKFYEDICGVAVFVLSAQNSETLLTEDLSKYPQCADAEKTLSPIDYLTELRNGPDAPTPMLVEEQHLSQLPLNASKTPRYPERAVAEGISGYALVEFTVLEDGSVDPDSVQVLESHPKGYFEEAASKQASEFKYKPMILNGEPQKVQAIRYKFNYNFHALPARGKNGATVQPVVFAQPRYPRKAQEEGVEGYVVVEFTVKKNGRVSKGSIKVIEAEPKGYFEEAAIAAMKAMRYEPPKVNGKSKKVKKVRHRFSFNLRKD
ncbi:MAG: energy transducer TonB [Kordiimonadaceae bacterium]|nr:energy transducer TonB [Kordiimonadaceae bacterium]MBO6567593.1 energy transducer TonB [Kordiimonadaceae bacterium]MBO6963193.1 energy transducer TonB [Kordiimonadaceae bacterium]